MALCDMCCIRFGLITVAPILPSQAHAARDAAVDAHGLLSSAYTLLKAAELPLQAPVRVQEPWGRRLAPMRP
eukprot:485636-Amphidinium_carterae.1